MGTATEYTLRQLLAELESGRLPTDASTETKQDDIITELQTMSSGLYAPIGAQFVVLALDGSLTNESLHSGLSGGDLHAPKAHTHVEADVTDLDHDAAKLQGRTLVATAPTDGQAVVWDAGNSQWEPASASGAGFYNAYVCVRDKKAQNTAGGTFTSGAWRTRDLADEQADAAGIASIASNQITLAAGTYRCLISCPARQVNDHQARLYNITDTAVLLDGSHIHAGSGGGVHNRSLIAGRFTLAAQKTLEVQHRCSLSRSDYGYGNLANFTDEIYTIAEFWRET